MTLNVFDLRRHAKDGVRLEIDAAELNHHHAKDIVEDAVSPGQITFYHAEAWSAVNQRMVAKAGGSKVILRFGGFKPAG